MSAAWQPEMDHLRRRVEALEKMLCQGHPAGVACGVCRPEPVPECTCPTCAPLMAWADYRKDYQPRDTVTASKAFFAGWEAYPDHHRDTPEPTSDTALAYGAVAPEVPAFVQTDIVALAVGAADGGIPAEVARAATVYNEAVSDGRLPLKAVMKALQLSKPTASRRVRAAKDLGLIHEGGK